MNWNYVNTVLLCVICFLTMAIFLLDISVNISWVASITDWLSVIIYFCTLCAAIWAGMTARKALKENTKMTKDNQRLVNSQTEPFVDIKLEVMPESVNWIRLKITNLGLSSAYHVKFLIKDMHTQNANSKKVIEKFMQVTFMREGLTYLSKGDSRDTSFVNLWEDDSERGFTQSDFLDTKFTIEIKYQNREGLESSSEFIIKMNDLDGYYRMGDKTFEEKLVISVDDLNTNLIKLCQVQENFGKEYEKTHRDWTEQELKLKLHSLEKNKKMREYLNLPPEKIKKMPNKMSIHEIRKRRK